MHLHGVPLIPVVLVSVKYHVGWWWWWWWNNKTMNEANNVIESIAEYWLKKRFKTEIVSSHGKSFVSRSLSKMEKRARKPIQRFVLGRRVRQLWFGNSSVSEHAWAIDTWLSWCFHAMEAHTLMTMSVAYCRNWKNHSFLVLSCVISFSPSLLRWW